MKRSSRSIFPFIVIAAGLIVLLGAGLWQLNPMKPLAPSAPTSPAGPIPLAEIPRVSLPDAKAAYDIKNAVFVDVRGEPFYSQGHIPGALSLPLAELSNRLGDLKPSDWIIPYCT
jgi:3-mercaptopyruvate sulfurtransferase SseA